MNFRKILIPVDFSSRSKYAIEHGVNIAKHFNAETIFLHAVPSFPYEAAFATSLPGGMLWTPGPELEESLKQRLEQWVEEVVPGQSGERLVVNGAVSGVIAEVVKRVGIDLIVMPTAGAGPFRRFLLGSVTAQVLSETECPVMTGPHMQDISAFGLQPYRRVGCAIDLEDQAAERILSVAASFAAAYRAELVMLHALPRIAVGGTGAFGAPEMAEMARTHATAELSKLLEGVKTSAKIVIEEGSPEDAVPRAAKENDIDVVVIGRHGEDGLLGGLQTHAYGIIRRSECPVLSV